MLYPSNLYYSPLHSYPYAADYNQGSFGYGSYYDYGYPTTYTQSVFRQPDSVSITKPSVAKKMDPSPVTLQTTSTKPLRVVDLDSPNPMTHSKIRYLGYVNELAEAFHDPMKQFIGSISPARKGWADSAVKFSYDVVLGYMIADAFGTGLKSYYHHKEQGDSIEYARAKGMQTGIGQALFQYIASYDLPARVIKHVINPTGKKGGLWLIQKHLLNTAPKTGIVGSLQRMASIHHPTMVTYSGTLLSLLSIPLLVKIIDPIAQHIVNYVWTKPTDRYIESHYQK